MNARVIAFAILMTFEKTNQRLEVITAEQLLQVHLNNRERKFVYNLTAGVLRHVTLFDWKLSNLFKGDYKKALLKLKVILRLALYEIDFLDYIPPHATINEYVQLTKNKINQKIAGMANAILRNYIREGKKFQPEKKFKFADTIISIKHSFPEWLVKRWIGFWGETETEALCSALNRRPVFDLRININKISPQDFCQILIKNSVSYEQSYHFPHVIKVTDMQKISGLGFFEKGYCSVQDESGILITELLSPENGDVILDACAAPGGKYLGLLEKNVTAELIGLDIDFQRLVKVKQNCQNLGFQQNWRLVQGDALKAPFRKLFIKILLDVPCSGFGTIQKHPDIKWRRTLKDIFQFQKYQLAILQSASQLLVKNGYLIYSTCTIDPAENEEVIKMFIEENRKKFVIIPPPDKFNDFILQDNFITTFPHKHNMDGSFAVILKKI
jgi:16S rRNA (cytosine967-C5)-methyltransferase